MICLFFEIGIWYAVYMNSLQLHYFTKVQRAEGTQFFNNRICVLVLQIVATLATWCMNPKTIRIFASVDDCWSNVVGAEANKRIPRPLADEGIVYSSLSPTNWDRKLQCMRRKSYSWRGTSGKQRILWNAKRPIAIV